MDVNEKRKWVLQYYLLSHHGENYILTQTVMSFLYQLAIR